MKFETICFKINFKHFTNCPRGGHRKNDDDVDDWQETGKVNELRTRNNGKTHCSVRLIQILLFIAPFTRCHGRM